ncbi:MAG: hypothetical protein IH840_02335 [Candidatus Heimdallarchaeota archaeon]|nr:hypothetical protein [Candidatus Heimdallarchaeota archaeon]
MQLIPNLKDSSLMQSTIENIELYFNHHTSSKNSVKFDDYDTYSLFVSGLDNQNLNTILLKSKDVDVIDIVDKNAVKFGPHFFQIWLHPDFDTDVVKERLLPLKYRYIGDSVVMGLEIAKLVRVSMPNSLYVEKITNSDRLNKWTEIAAVKHVLRGNQVQAYFEMFNSFYDFSKTDLFTKYIGWLNGEPAATSTLIAGKHSAMIFDEAILMRLKRKTWGVDDGVTYKSVVEAGKQDYKVLTALCSVGEMRRYMALGFEEITRIAKFINRKK